MLDLGVSDSNDLFDLRNSRHLLLWGKNPAVSNVNLVPLLKECQEHGANVVLIDPVAHKSTQFSSSGYQRTSGSPPTIFFLSKALFRSSGDLPSTRATNSLKNGPENRGFTLLAR